MKNSKSNFLPIHSPNLGFWIILIFASLIPSSLSRFGMDLYILPQIEFSMIFFATIFLKVYSWQIFLYGLLVDVAYGKPIGTSPLILLLIYFVIGKLKFKLENLSPRSIFLNFTYTIIIVKTLEHIILSIYYSSNIVPYFGEIIINIIVNVVFYILLHYILYKRIYSKHHENK